MPDWLTHVLVGYALATALSVRYEWLDARFVTLAMLGALLPDLSKLELVVPSDAVAGVLGVPFDWGAFHTLGGTAVVVAAIALTFPARYRRPSALALSLGAISHHALDLLLTNASGQTYAFLWPLTAYRAPAVGSYSSNDPVLAVAAALLALTVWFVRVHVATPRRRDRPDEMAS